jgi:hypothetical protein
MDEKIDRRTFLKTAASGAAGTLVSSPEGLIKATCAAKIRCCTRRAQGQFDCLQ